MQSSTFHSPWFAVSLGLAGVIAGYALGSGLGSTGQSVTTQTGAAQIAQRPSPSPSPAPAPQPAGNPANADDDIVMGSENAEVTLIEFSDFQCPFCKRFRDQTFDQIKSQYIDTGKVKFVYRDFPLDSIHPNARGAAIAAECVRELDKEKFWPYHDRLFAEQGSWAQSGTANDAFKQYATDLGLDIATCLDSRKFDPEVSKDLADGQSAGITGTPGFWILGPGGQSQKLSGAQPFASFQTVFDQYLQ